MIVYLRAGTFFLPNDALNFSQADGGTSSTDSVTWCARFLLAHDCGCVGVGCVCVCVRVSRSLCVCVSLLSSLVFPTSLGTELNFEYND